MRDDITPGRKGQKILDCCRRLLVSQSITLRNLEILLGLLEFSRPAIWQAPLHVLHLKSDLTRDLQMNRSLTTLRLPCQRVPEYRTCLVVETYPQCKRQSRASSSTEYDNHYRSPQEGLGCSASVPSDQWQMVTRRVSPTHQLSRAKGALLSFENLSQRQVSRNRISAVRQHDRHRLHQQQTGYTLSPTYDSGLRDVALVSCKRHLCDSFSHPRKRQRLCGKVAHCPHKEKQSNCYKNSG